MLCHTLVRMIMEIFYNVESYVFEALVSTNGWHGTALYQHIAACQQLNRLQSTVLTINFQNK